MFLTISDRISMSAGNSPFSTQPRMILSHEEEMKFKTAFMLFAGREYHRLDWAMQLHYGCKRGRKRLRAGR